MLNSYYNYPHFDQWGDASYLSGNDCFDLNRFQRSEAGRDLAAARSLMTEYSDVDDPALLRRWESIGVRCEVLRQDDEPFLVFAPLQAYENRCEKLPVMLIFRPVGLLAEAFYLRMIELAAQGEFIAMIYCDEDPDGNDRFLPMLEQVRQKFSVDDSRIYVTGHSHYGELAMEFMRRHHQKIAGVAQQGDTPGMILQFFGLTQAKLEQMHEMDMPLSLITGTTEMVGPFPINTDAPGVSEDSFYRRSPFPMNVEDRIRTWQNRLYAMNCPISTPQEILDAAQADTVRKVLGVPCDRTEVMYFSGAEYYKADFRNNNGDFHFQVIGVENLPHTTCTVMHDLSWSYLRRFARDLRTGAVIERY